MDRSFVIQQTLNLFPEPDYLEIGVDAGTTFHAVTAARKTAVDPAFKFPVPANVAGGSTAYHQVNSDTYFAVIDSRSTQYDVVFIDGLHTFEQVLRDFLNAVSVLKPHGVIIIDDITPNSYHAGLPNLSETFAVRDYVARWHPELAGDQTWMGDVYKIVFFINAFMQQFSFATVAENHGQLMVWRAPREVDRIGTDRFLDVALVDFKDTVLRRSAFGLTPLGEILDRIRSRPGPP